MDFHADPNAAAKEYLFRYLTAGSTDSAVMLTGKSGSGRTTLVRTVAEKANVPALFVSLYGARTLAPLTQKLELLAAGAELRDHLIVVDDLERCAMPVAEVLAYLAGILEQSRCKLILITNEADTKRIDSEYKRQRDRLVGRCLEIQPAVDSIIRQMVDAIQFAPCRSFVSQHVCDLINMFRKSGTGNLRLVKLALADFEDITRCLEPRHWANAQAVAALFRLLICLLIEVRAGRIDENTPLPLSTGAAGRAIERAQRKSKTALPDIADRYPELDFDTAVLTEPVLRDIIFRGIWDKASLSTALDASTYFRSSETMPAWMRLWSAMDLSEAEFEAALNIFLKQFSEREFTALPEITQIFGISLWLCEMGAIKCSGAEMVSRCKRYIDDLARSGRLPPLSDAEDKTSAAAAADQLVPAANSFEFGDIMNHLQTVRRQLLDAALRRHAQTLSDLMTTDQRLFYVRLNDTSNPENTFATTAILHFLEPASFVKKLLGLEPVAQRIVMRTLQARYAGNRIELVPMEKDWIRQVRQVLRTNVLTAPPVTRYRLERMAEWYIDRVLSFGNMNERAA